MNEINVKRWNFTGLGRKPLIPDRYRFKKYEKKKCRFQGFTDKLLEIRRTQWEDKACIIDAFDSFLRDNRRIGVEYIFAPFSSVFAIDSLTSECKWETGRRDTRRTSTLKTHRDFLISQRRRQPYKTTCRRINTTCKSVFTITARPLVSSSKFSCFHSSLRV